MNKERGKLIVVEGGVGAGKDTISQKLLSKQLKGWNYYHEPGSTPFAELVRSAVQGRHGYDVHPYAALLGYNAARADLVRGRIIPDMKEGKNVLLNRYWPSTYAYQGAEGISKPLIMVMSYVATNGLKPDLILHYDLLPEIGIKRKKLGYQSDIDRYDAKELEFHREVRKNYNQIARLFPRTWVKIDASGTKDEIYENTVDVLAGKGIF
jgi:dTMP kinase